MRIHLVSSLTVVVTLLAGLSAPAPGMETFERAPIHYSTTDPHDPVTQLRQRIEAGEAKLPFVEDYGYLPAVLQELNIPASSQMLVFSKTSFQQKRISPRAPRAVYFNDQTYVGWVQHGDVLEISTVDPRQGAMFYSLQQRETDKPEFVRHTHECLQCHSSSLTQSVPGHLVRSVYPDADGFPILRAGTFRTDQTSPLTERWGGWYVSGTHGSQRHMGNAVAGEQRDVDDRVELDTSAGANVTDLSDHFDTSRYLAPHSDIVALLVLEHQTQMHNHIARVNYATRLALHDAQIIDRMLKREPGELSPSTVGRIQRACEPLLCYMLFVDEAELSAPVRGTSKFAAEFSARGPVDKRGRSLRALDLGRRLFKYPCSYLIYSRAFDELPAIARQHIYRRLWDVLTGKDDSPTFAHLSPDDRQAIREILVGTKLDLPHDWRS